MTQETHVNTIATAIPSFWSVVRRAFKKRCPRCGEGKLFAGYLKQVEACTVCGENFGHIRADDGPAWLTIMLVGHILAPFMFIIPKTGWPEWLTMTVWIAAAIVLIYLLLPRCKGIFLGILWRNEARAVK